MKSTKASLTETIQYLCRGKVLASETRELASVSRGKIRPGEGKEWLNEQMYVPPVPPTNLRGCHLINVLYHVYVSASIMGCNNLKMIQYGFFPIVRDKSEEFGQRNQVTNPNSIGHISFETRRWIRWYCSI